MKSPNILLSLVAAVTMTFGVSTSSVQGQCLGDVVPSGIIDGVDLAQILSSWGPCANCPADIDGDGAVTGIDLGQLLAGWGPCPPFISSVAPGQGTIVGGTPITISGVFFTGVTSVSIGGALATNMIVVSSTTITAVTPAHAAGSVSITIATPSRASTLKNAFSYASSSILSVAPNAGGVGGGALITISGNYLGGATSVTIGGAPATNLVVVSPTIITAVTPTGTLGPADVVVTTPAGILTSLNGFSYVSILVPTWARLLEAMPDPAVVTDANLRAAIAASGFAWRIKDTSSNIEMLLVPAGTFMMGCSASTQWGGWCDSNEFPIHQVTLTNAFYMGRYEVTQAQWTAKMGNNPSRFVPANGYSSDTTKPVEYVSWNMIASGSTSFMSLTGLRLPTEAEWEYAYRAGTTTAFHSYPAQPTGFNDDTLLDNIAWYSGNNGAEGSSNYGTKAVGGKFANGLGLHDMAGNVGEWCQDWYSDSYYASSPLTNPTGPATGASRLVRGGYWCCLSTYCRGSPRSYNVPDNPWSTDVGFRVVRTP
jgi:formylglycine-generating enzyme required for sulfatase activity